jgi:heme exporter protein D
VNLQADSKSDVEGVRWVLTRRVILTLGIIVMMVVSSLKLYSNSVHEKEQEKRRRSKMRNAQSQTDDDRGGRGGNGNGNNNHNHNHNNNNGGGGNGSPVGGLLVSEGDNPAFVSLG